MHVDPSGAWSYCCFNCNYKAKFMPGETVSRNAKRLLLALGLSDDDISVINIESVKRRGLLNYIEPPRVEFVLPTFTPIPELPGELLNPNNPAHSEHIAYVKSRNLDPKKLPFLASTEPDRPGILIPFTYRGEVVGYTTRFLSSKGPKYLSVQPNGYLYGLDFQLDEWNTVIVVEGPFDAMSINGLATMHQVMSREQLALIKSLGKDVIVVPDQDKSGMSIVDQAINEGFSVSIPEWHPGVKDVNDAAKIYGRLGALLTILENKESSPIKIDMRRRALAQRCLHT